MGKIELFMRLFDNLCAYDWKDFEVALLLWLRGDIEMSKDKNIVNKLKGILDKYDSILDIYKEELDIIIDLERGVE